MKLNFKIRTSEELQKSRCKAYKYIIPLLLFPIFTFSQTVQYNAYTSYYNSVTKIPDSVIWIAKPHIKTVGRETEFHSTGGRQNFKRDYIYSGYDIGHNADASDMDDNKIDEYNSFDFVNTYPKCPNCNRLVWLQLENYTRELHTSVRVKVSWDGIKGHIGKDNITVPEYCIKELWYNGKYEKYVIPNNDTVSRRRFNYYKR